MNNRCLLALVCAFGLTACKTEIAVDLYASDLVGVTEGSSFTAPVVLGLEMSSSECEENGAGMVDAMSGQLNDVEFIGCARNNFDHFARYRAQVEILDIKDGQTRTDDALALGVEAKENRYDVFFVSNPDAAQQIWNNLPEDLTKYQTFNLKPRLAAVFNNDLRKDVTVVTDDVFADGVPVQGMAQHTLGRRDQVELRLSDVTNAAFADSPTLSHIVSFAVIE